MKQLDPPNIRAPFGAYSHGIAVPAGWRLLVTSGQLGADANDNVPSDVTGQAEICFGNISAILGEAGMSAGDVIRINAFVTRREYFPAYMAARDAWLDGTGPLPASTLVIVSGFTRPEFLVEIEVTAAAP